MKQLVFESLNELNSFNQTKDPLSSLGVGQIHLIRSWLDKMGVEDYTINDDLTIDVNGNVDLSHQNFVGFPSYIRFNKVGGGFWCSYNQLTSLVGCPSQVGGSFYCSYNQLTSLVGCPSKVGGGFWCGCNPGKFTKEDVLKLCKVDRNRIYV